MVLILFVEVLKSLKFELKNPAETLISIKHVIPMRDQISAQMSSSSIKYESLVHNFKDWFYFSFFKLKHYNYQFNLFISKPIRIK